MNLKTIMSWELKSNSKMKNIFIEAEAQFPKISEEEALSSIAAIYKGLADETRLKIITLLLCEDLCMCEIVEALGGASSTVSHHLKILEKGKLIHSRREGKFTVFSIDKEKVVPLLDYLK